MLQYASFRAKGKSLKSKWMAKMFEVRVKRIILEREKHWRTKFAFKVRRRRKVFGLCWEEKFAIKIRKKNVFGLYWEEKLIWFLGNSWKRKTLEYQVCFQGNKRKEICWTLLRRETWFQGEKKVVSSCVRTRTTCKQNEHTICKHHTGCWIYRWATKLFLC